MPSTILNLVAWSMIERQLLLVYSIFSYSAENSAILNRLVVQTRTKQKLVNLTYIVGYKFMSIAIKFTSYSKFLYIDLRMKPRQLMHGACQSQRLTLDSKVAKIIIYLNINLSRNQPPPDVDHAEIRHRSLLV